MNIPMPRAKIGDVVVFDDDAKVYFVDTMRYLREKKTWRYYSDKTGDVFYDKDILMNLTTGTDYQEKEETVKCFHPVTIQYEGKRRCQTCLEEMF